MDLETQEVAAYTRLRLEHREENTFFTFNWRRHHP
jgi:hypothetical protein